MGIDYRLQPVPAKLNRRHARLKHVLKERGVTCFREPVARYLGGSVAPPAEMGRYNVTDHLGWQQ